MSANYKQQVVDLLKAHETGDPKPFSYINPTKYIQHDLDVAEGAAGVAALAKSLPPGIASRRRWSSWSDLGHATIDDQFDAGDIATFVRSEKRHHFGNLVQGSGATEGYLAHGAVCVLLDLFFRHPQRIAISR